MALALIALVGFLATPSLGRSELSCGEAPLVADESLKAEIKGGTQLLSGLIGKAELNARIETARTDIFSKFPNADKVRMQAYFSYVFCTQVLSDARLSPQERAQLSLVLLPDTDNPVVTQLKQEALKAISIGAYNHAESLVAAAQNQISAVLLLDDGHPDLALNVLRQAEQLLGDIRTESSARNRVQRGFVYKTYAQAFAARGNNQQAEQYLALALRTFEEVKNDPNLDRKTTDEFAGAINGIGNIHYQRGQYKEAISNYRLATSLAPNYAYSWHDMFLAYVELAKRGEVDLAAMRMALDRVKETASGWPGIDATRIAGLERMLADLEKSSSPSRAPKAR
jgi:tetratricopeptide (TPR) repeat protein